MGEQKENKKHEEKKIDRGKKNDGNITVVFKADMNRDRCAKEINLSVKGFNGVLEVKADTAESKLTIILKADPVKQREMSESKAKAKKKPHESTVVSKIPLHCEGCAKKIRTAILKIEGVREVITDLKKDQVTVTGVMDIEVLQTYYLKEKL